MILQSSSSVSFDFFRVASSPSACPCRSIACSLDSVPLLQSRRRRKLRIIVPNSRSCGKSRFLTCAIGGDHGNVDITNTARKSAKNFIVARFSNEFEGEELSHGRELANESSIQTGSSNNNNNFTNFQEDPIVDKLRNQLGVIHPIPSPPINRKIGGLFVLFFFVGVVFDKLWTSRRRRRQMGGGAGGLQRGQWPQVPTSFSLFLEDDLQRKESVEWVNMVLVKLWKVYRGGIENWIIGLLQPVIDDLKKPDYVQRVEIKQFSLGDEPLSVRNVERRTSRRANDLQYQIGLRYTGGARMLLMLSLKFGIFPVIVPVGVRDFDIDGELWVKLRLIPTEPYVGAVSWAFVSLPRIKFELSPFRLFNLMAIPVLSMFLTKLLTEDLPRLFVRPKKIVLDFQKGKAVGPVSYDFKSGEMQEKNEDFVGELSVTLIDARKLPYVFYGKTDPYVILNLGDQVIRSKKNSQTTVVGPPGEPIWNQDFYFLVANPRKQKLYIQVNDSLGFADLTIGTGEVDLGPLQDTVPTDRIVALRGGWGLLSKGSAGELLLRLTYKAYVEDEEDEVKTSYIDASDDELSDSDEQTATSQQLEEVLSDRTDRESFMDVLAALIVSEEFQGIVSSEAGYTRVLDSESTPVAKPSRSGSNSESATVDSGKGSDSTRGSPLLWFSVITGVLVLIAINMSGASFFNP